MGRTTRTGCTVYSNAFLLMMVPHAIITVSLATAMLPSVSRLAAEGDLVRVRSELARTMRLALSIIVPFAAGLAVLGPAVGTILVGWGRPAATPLPSGTR